MILFFFFNDPATTEIYTLSLHDALPIFGVVARLDAERGPHHTPANAVLLDAVDLAVDYPRPQQVRMHAAGVNLLRCAPRSEEHTSELQSRQYLVCRLLLEKKKKHSTSCH